MVLEFTTRLFTQTKCSVSRENLRWLYSRMDLVRLDQIPSADRDMEYISLKQT